MKNREFDCAVMRFSNSKFKPLVVPLFAAVVSKTESLIIFMVLTLRGQTFIH
jgi:hypothetical protein